MTAGRTIVVAGGGTGGHVYPVLAVIDALRSEDPTLRFVYIGQIGGPEHTLVARANIPFVGIHAEKLRRYWDLRTLFLPVRILQGIVEAWQQLGQIRPAVVFLKGGYVILPVAIAAWLRGIPIVLHETDATMGLANRLVAPLARRVALSFPRSSYAGRVRSGFVSTGHPIMPAFFQESRTTQSTRPVLLVAMGSQGATSVNELLKPILPKLLERYRVIHLTGERDLPAFRRAFASQQYEPMAYTHDFAAVLRRADLVLSRAGGTIFELATLGKPTILIPLPSAANDHQRVNARELERRGAAVVLEQVALTPDVLYETIASLMRDTARRNTLAERIGQFARPDAAKQVAKLVLSIAKP
ncbi:MAG: undecaprenyldiphospho-muramoylpentapeptide beta-N-acetylglucosaminyltransferase [Patescibacteria group bacterium]